MIKLLVLVTLLCGTQAFYTFGRDYTRTKLSDAIDKGSLKMLKEAYEVAEDKNVIASPLGVMILLSMFAPGAGSLSKTQINKFLDEDEHQSTQSYSHLSQRFAELDPNFLTVANKIYVSDKYQLAFPLSSSAYLFRSGVENINFSSPKDAVDVINHWADQQTKGHIKTPVSEDVIDADTAVALFNVIFFQGHWDVPFNASQTEEKDFHIDENTVVKKPTMRLLRPLYYTESKQLGARIVELPYKETGFRMVVVLPDVGEELSAVLEKASHIGLLDDVYKLFPPNQDVELEIPKFEIRSSLDLNEILPKVGVSKIFEEAAPGVVKDDEVVVSKAFQKAFVKIDEEGATAGAFTGMVMVPMMSNSEPPPPIQFKVDRPFLFLILHEDKVLFGGTYTH